MTKRDVLSIALRVLGVWCFISVILSIPYLVFYLHPPAGVGGLNKHSAGIVLVGLIAEYAVLFVLGCVLVGATDALSRRFVRDDAVITIPAGANMRSVFQLAVRVMGLAILAKWIPEIVPAIFYIFGITQLAMYGTEYTVSVVVAIVIGAYLIIGAPHLVNLIFSRQQVERRQSHD